MVSGNIQSLVESWAQSINAWVILLPDGPTRIRDGTEIERKDSIKTEPRRNQRAANALEDDLP